jgi:hypothetical protein
MTVSRAMWQIAARHTHPHNESEVLSVTVALTHAGRTWEIDIQLSPPVADDKLEKSVLGELAKIREALAHIRGG